MFSSWSRAGLALRGGDGAGRANGRRSAWTSTGPGRSSSSRVHPRPGHAGRRRGGGAVGGPGRCWWSPTSQDPCACTSGDAHSKQASSENVPTRYLDCFTGHLLVAWRRRRSRIVAPRVESFRRPVPFGIGLHGAPVDPCRIGRPLFPGTSMPYPPLDLSGRVAVVVGGTSGIGQAIALGLAEAGADVVPTSRRARAGAKRPRPRSSSGAGARCACRPTSPTAARWRSCWPKA